MSDRVQRSCQRVEVRFQLTQCDRQTDGQRHLNSLSIDAQTFMFSFTILVASVTAQTGSN